MVPKVDTFALDISDEIKRKNADLAEVVPPSSENHGSIPSSTAPPKNTFPIPWLFIWVVLGGIVALSLLVSFLYSSYQSLSGTPVVQTKQATEESEKKVSISFLSKTLSENIGRHIASVEKKDKGVVITFTSYSQVFGYMTKNEENYIHELVEYFSKKGTATTTKQLPSPQPKPQTKEPQTITTSSTTKGGSGLSSGTSSVIASSSLPTKVVLNQEKSTSTPSHATNTPSSDSVSIFNALFRDVTIANINIRSYVGSDGGVAYAFISDKKLIIAGNADDIVVINNMIVR